MLEFFTMTVNMVYIFIFRSGTEEDFNELHELLEDIYTFRRV